MDWLFVLATGILVSEAFFRLPLFPVVRRVTATAQKSGKVLASKRISDHWKEKVLPSYAWIIGKGSIQFIAMLLLALTPVAVLGLIYPGGFSAWEEVLLQPLAIVVLCVVSVGHIWLRLKVARV